MKDYRKLLKRALLAGITAFSLMQGTTSTVHAAEMDNYCATPPFLSNAVPPNVLIILDNSGSLNDQAYSSDYNPAQFSSGHYYGYFNPTANYQYNGSRWVVTGAAVASGTVANPIVSGNLLNWATMRRVDVAKKLLIGGKASPRSPSAGITVKLYGEDSSSSWDFTKEYDSTSTPELIDPFVGEYRFRMAGDELSIVPVNPGTDTHTTRPNGNVSIAAGWTVSGVASAFDAVDEGTSDGNTTYIQNQANRNPAIFDYDYTGPKAGTITNVSVVVVARKSSSSTMRLQGVMQIGGTNYASNFSSLSTSYATYSFNWATNPATGAAWEWSEIKSSGAGSLAGFGIQAATTPTTTNYPRVTQVYLVVTSSMPTGGPYRTIVDQDMVQASGLIDTLSSSTRFGLAFYNRGDGRESGTAGGRYDGGHIENYIDFGSAVNMITKISNMTPSTWTPLAETLYEMIRYFRQDSPYYSGNSPADYAVDKLNDPYYYQYSKLAGSALSDRYVPCAKSFILFLTDGESTMDTNIPDAMKDYDGSGGESSGSSANSFSTTYLDDIAFWGRTADQRSDLTGTQNVVLYPVFLFGRGSSLLRNAAINGGFNDLNKDGRPGPDLEEYMRDTNGDGALALPDTDPNTEDDLPLTYFEGDDGFELESSITEAIASILKRAASGTAVSVLTTSSRGVGSLVQAYFLPTKQEGIREVTWTGFTQNIWIDDRDDLREDTINDHSLLLAQDKVLKLFFDQTTSETKVATFTTDEDGDNGTLASCSGEVVKEFSEITPLWEAGKKLALKPASRRVLFTSKTVVRGGSTTTLPGDPYPLFDTGMDASLKSELNPANDNVIGYVRGECLEAGGGDVCGSTLNSSYRDRRVTVAGGSPNGNVWKLGDIISSTPKVFANTGLNNYHVDYGDKTYFDFITGDSYKEHPSVAFVGANDGMVHAFRVGYLKDQGLTAPVRALFKNLFSSADGDSDQLGEELWGFIPFNAFPYLKHLSNPNYCHLYFNDLSVKLMDVSIGGTTDSPTDTRTKESWRTVLIGGMRFGGACTGGTPAPPAPIAPTASVGGFSSYFAIDITDPVNPIPMWEFSDQDMGYATTAPSVIRTGDMKQNGHWYVAVGSGSTQLPKNATDIARGTPGYIYLIDLKTGAMAKKIALDHNGIVGDTLAVDEDKDYVSERLYFGTAYQAATWRGKVVVIGIPDQDLSAPWTPGVKYLFHDAVPFTASPEVVRDNDKNIWVYAGSGKYYSDIDEQDGTQQYFIGFKDLLSGITYPLDLSAGVGLDDRTTTATQGKVTGTKVLCLYDSTLNKFTKQTVVTSIEPTSTPPPPSTKGWYIRLTLTPSAERVITRPLATGGLVDFLTYKPDSDPCSYGGVSFLYAVGYTTGVAPDNVALLNPTTPTSGTVTIDPRIQLGPGAPPTGEAIIVKDEKLNKKIQVSTGTIVEAKNNPPIEITSKIFHWLRK